MREQVLYSLWPLLVSLEAVLVVTILVVLCAYQRNETDRHDQILLARQKRKQRLEAMAQPIRSNPLISS